jgi:hypothetical protein
MKHIHNRTKYFIDGVPAIDVARQNGICKGCIYDRLKAGWDLRRACTYKKIPYKTLARMMGVEYKYIVNLLVQGYKREDIERMANDNKR